MLSQNGKEQMELHIETLPRRRSLNLQLCVDGQALDPVSLEGAPGADDEGLDRGGGEVGLEPKPARLWWTRTHADEKMDDIRIRTSTGLHKLPFEKKFKFLGYTFNQVRRMQDSLGESMWSANKACWRDVKFYRSKDVPWRIKCRRMVEQCILLRERKLVLEKSDDGQN